MMIRTAAAILLLSTPAMAQDITVTPCGDGQRVDTIAEPWDQNTATYSEGAIRVARLDMVEPAAAAWQLVVISPPRDELGFPQCRVIGADGMGFYSLDFAARKASYDPQRGLTLTMPAKRYTDLAPEGGDYTLSVTINQQTGDIAAQALK